MVGLTLCFQPTHLGRGSCGSTRPNNLGSNWFAKSDPSQLPRCMPGSSNGPLDPILSQQAQRWQAEWALVHSLSL
ncbi:hypothetical protein V6N11_021764 [Hibiscus sabdariffa]|uniref:Uncharacterized protein n=1 Tax=Hibiscus sabdariffa TaxID=183260 RepID=A0ABR2THH1_9ROSI